MFPNLTAEALQVLESYMVPNIYNLVHYTPAVYGERDLMTVRRCLHTTQPSFKP